MRNVPVSYLAKLAAGKIALWCFLIWYLATVIHHFDPTPAIWLNALGISAIIGVALYLSVLEPGRPRPDRWTVVRLFLMPFCVSSFSQLIKGKGFVLVFPPALHENVIALAACAGFVFAVLIVKRLASPRSA
jgi:branched-subunit amino acid ABC-type transport system permease component